MLMNAAAAMLACWFLALPQAAPVLASAPFEADLDFLLQTIERRHPDYTHAHSRKEWDEVAAGIRARLQGLDANGFAVELLRLFRLLEDGHSDLFIPMTPLMQRTWKLRMEAFADGVHVTAAAPELAATVGGRVVALGGRPIEVVLHDADAFAWGDNSETRRRNALRLLSLADVHRTLGLASAPDESSITVTLADGTERRFELSAPGPAGSHDGRLPSGWSVARPPAAAETPLADRFPSKSWWFEPVEEGDTVYFQFNAVQDDSNETLAQFCARLFEYLDATEAQRLIIDLRRNHGGNSYLNQPLIHGLIRNERVNRPGHLFVLTSPDTFSAAVNAASDLERETQALFVGEPTGAGPNHFGDAELLTLPATRLPFYCSTVHWQKTDPRDVRRWILPDLVARPTFADRMAGRDAALEAALAADAATFEAQPPLTPVSRWGRSSQGARWPPAR